MMPFIITTADAARAAQQLRNLDVSAIITIPAAFDSAYDAHRADPVDDPDQQPQPGLH